MNTVKVAASCGAIGAMCMYFADPDRGKRRRALVRDRFIATWHDFSGLTDKARRDALNRSRGAACAIQSVFKDHKTDDPVLVERVRSRLGRLVSHPHAIDVSAANGIITLKGLILSNEIVHLLRCVRAIPGVKGVQDRLEGHDSSEHISSLQGGTPRESRSEIMQQNWTPALRMAAGALGSTMLWRAAQKGGPLGSIAGVSGGLLMARALFNREFRDIAGLSGGAGQIRVDKTIRIQKPVEEVFRFWSDFEGLPRFMSHLTEVRDLGGGISHWTAEGPGGLHMSWEAEVTECTPNQLIAWRSRPGSMLGTEGIVRFEPTQKDGTRVNIRMCYKPPAGLLGHCIMALFGSDPKSALTADLVRLKSLMERGITHAHGMKVRCESLQAV